MRGLSRVKIPGIADCLAQPTAWLSDPLITVVTVLLPSPGVAGKSLTLIQRSALGPRVALSWLKVTTEFVNIVILPGTHWLLTGSRSPADPW